MERGSGKWMKPLAALGRYKYVLVVAALGALLLAWPQGARSSPEENSASESAALLQNDLAATEAALEEILATINAHPPERRRKGAGFRQLPALQRQRPGPR